MTVAPPVRATGDLLERIREDVPTDLLSQPRWVGWNGTRKPDGKLDKTPLNPRTGAPAKSNEAGTWSPFPEAAEFALREPCAGGVGFMLTESEYWALDLDHVINTDTGELLPAAVQFLERITPTYIERSPSGDGLHVIYRGRRPEVLSGSGWNKSPNAFGPKKQLEVFGGSSAHYITMTGAVFSESAHLAEASAATVDAVVALFPPVEPQRPRNEPGRLVGRIDDPAVEIAKARAALAVCKQHGRLAAYDDWLLAGMALRTSFGDAGFSLWVEASNDGDHEFDKKWISFKRDDVTVRTVFSWADAIDGGAWREPFRVRGDGVAPPRGGEVQAAAIEKPRTGPALRSLVETLKRGRLEPGLLSKRPPARPMVFRHPDGKGMAPAAKVWQTIGAGGVGKSTVLAQMAISIVVNRPLFGCLPVDAAAAGRAVAMLLAEDEQYDVWERLYRIAEALGLTEDERRKVEDRVYVVALAGEDVNLQAIDERDGMCRPSLAYQAIEDQLRADAPADGYALVLVDPQSRFAPAAEGKHTGAGTHLVQLLERWTRLPGRPSVGTTHHTTKESRKRIPGQPRQRSAATDGRGKTEIPDAARWVCSLSEDGDRVAFSQVKSNHTKPMPDDLILVRDEGGVLRVDGASAGQSTAQVFENEERESRIRRLVEALRAHGHPVTSKNTIVELARPMKATLGRAAVDLAIGRGLIVQGGTSKAPTFTARAAGEGPGRGGEHPPHPPCQGPRDLGPDYGGGEVPGPQGTSGDLGTLNGLEARS